MKFAKKVLPILLIALTIVGCDFLKKALTKGVAHTASRINSIQAIGDSKEVAIVDIEYVFTGTGASSDDQAVFGREGSEARDTVEIELSGTVFADVDTTLLPNSTYTYNLWILSGNDLEEYDEVTVKTLPVVEITLPADTLMEDAVEVKWKKLSYEGEDYLKYKVAIYDAEGVDLTDPTSFSNFMELATPLEGPVEVELGTSDTEGSYTFSVSAPALASGYVVSVNTEKGIFDKLSNQSTGLKPFLWVGL